MLISRGKNEELPTTTFPIISDSFLKVNTRAISLARKSVISGNYLLLWAGNALEGKNLGKSLEARSGEPLDSVLAALSLEMKTNCPNVEAILCFHDLKAVGSFALGTFSHEREDGVTLVHGGSGGGDLYYDLGSMTGGKEGMSYAFCYQKLGEAIVRELSGELFEDPEKLYGGGWEVFFPKMDGGFRRLPISINIFYFVENEKVFVHKRSVFFQPGLEDTAVAWLDASQTHHGYDFRGILVSEFGGKPKSRGLDPSSISFDLSLNLFIGRTGFAMNAVGSKVPFFDWNFGNVTVDKKGKLSPKVKVSQKFCDFQESLIQAWS